jgi:hypothetical protein
MKRKKRRGDAAGSANPITQAPSVPDESLEGVEVDREVRQVEESLETDAAALVDRAGLAERPSPPGGCSLPDEERSKPSDLG